MGVLLKQAERVLRPSPFSIKGIESLCIKYGQAYEQRAELHLQALFSFLGEDEKKFEAACENFAAMTYETLRLQQGYFKGGAFTLTRDPDEPSPYEDPDLMPGRYLQGLYLAAMFWENHYEKLVFFEKAFLPRLADGARVLDVGAGHGVMTALCRRARADVHLVANDISSHSRPMVEGIHFGTASSSPEPEFVLGDFADQFVGQMDVFQAVIFSEVVEHLSDPQAGMRKLSEILKPGGLVFFTTATHAAFYDHTSVFESEGQVRALLAHHGFEILKEKVLLVMEGPEGKTLKDVSVVAFLSPQADGGSSS